MQVGNSDQLPSAPQRAEDCPASKYELLSHLKVTSLPYVVNPLYVPLSSTGTPQSISRKRDNA